MKYRTIVADPPWEMKAGPSSNSFGKSRDLAFPSLSVDEIAALPVGDWADCDCHLYLWTINAYVEAAYRIVRAWGFRPSTLGVWCKSPKGIALGGTYALSTEFVLFARRGSLTAFERVNTTWWRWPRGRHSAKPEAFLDMVERVSPGPRLELFARRDRLGWDTWGNEALGSAPALRSFQVPSSSA